jgi:hypothetical protein
MNKKWLVGIGVFVGLMALSQSAGASDAPLDDPAQEAYIQNLHAFARPRFRQFIRAVEAQTGWKVIIASGYRTFAKQLQLWNENHSNGTPGGSYHNYGMALDINVRKGNIQLHKSDSSAAWYSTGVPQLAEAMGFEWGGGGNFGSYHDPVHFDVRKLLSQQYHYNTTDQLKAKAFSQFGTNWNDIQGNKLIL